jgi:hypothetical protein
VIADLSFCVISLYHAVIVGIFDGFSHGRLASLGHGRALVPVLVLTCDCVEPFCGADTHTQAVASSRFHLSKSGKNQAPNADLGSV